MTDFQKNILVMLIGVMLSTGGTVAVLSEKISNVEGSLNKIEDQLTKRVDRLESRQRVTDIQLAKNGLLAAR